MTPEQFAYWLQGFVELNGSLPTPEQWQSVKAHLATVFRKVTPPGPGQAIGPGLTFAPGVRNDLIDPKFVAIC